MPPLPPSSSYPLPAATAAAFLSALLSARRPARAACRTARLAARTVSWDRGPTGLAVMAGGG